MLAKTVTKEEEVATAVEGVTKDYIDVIEAYGDSRATDTQKTAVLNYEKKYGLKDGEKVQPGAEQTTTTSTTQQQEGDPATNQLLQQLLDQNKKLAERLDKMDGERTTATRKQQLSEIFSKLPENLRKPYERVSVDSLTDEQFTTLLSEVTTEVNGLVAEINSKGAVFGRPTTHGGTQSQEGELTDAQKAAIATREGKASGEGQPF